jgi:hypothetical protein
MTTEADQDFPAITMREKETGETARPSRPSRFTRNLYVRCPAVLPPAVETAAQRQCMTSSEYVRRSVVERLSADGFDVSQRQVSYASTRPLGIDPTGIPADGGNPGQTWNVGADRSCDPEI